MASNFVRVTMVAGVTLTTMSMWLLPAAAAQDVATSFDALQALVKKGDVVIVTDVSGKRTRGRLGELTASSLELLISSTGSDGRQTLVPQTPWPQASVTSVVLERRDPLWNGALIGLGIGVSVPLILTATNCPGNACSEYYTLYIGMLITGGVGAAAGALVDSVLHKRVIVYQASAQRAFQFDLIPLLARSGTGVRVSVRF